MKLKTILLLITLTIFTGCDRAQSSSVDLSTVETPKQWKESIVFSGRGNLQSQLFTISGEVIKIICQFTGNQKDSYVVYLLKAGNSINKDGGFPLILEHGNGSREIFKNPKSGDYYFHVLTNETEWTITLYEEL